jgi:uncharacterized surface protein with fasciclin (FAS1) repeats
VPTTGEPSPAPSPEPSPNPTDHPTGEPSPAPSPEPSPSPTESPSPAPTTEPSSAPSLAPSPAPSPHPTESPTESPSVSHHPTPEEPSDEPSDNPTQSEEPSDNPTRSEEPSNNPTQSEEPSNNPTQSEEPSEFPTQSEEPSEFPTQSEEPSENPTFFGSTIVTIDDDNIPIPPDAADLLDIICSTANAGSLGIFCFALLITGQASLLDVGRGGRRNLQQNNDFFNPSNIDSIVGQINTNQFNNVFNQQQITANVNNIIDQFDTNNNNVVDNTVGKKFRQYTVFGPINDAFKSLDNDTFDFLFNKPAGLPVLRTIVRNHILSGGRINLEQLLCDSKYLMESNEETTTLCRGGGGGNNNNNNNDSFKQEFLDNAIADVVSQLNGGRRVLQNDVQRKYQVGIGNGDVVKDWPKITAANFGAVNGVLHIVDHVILPKPAESPVKLTISKF